MGSYSIKPSYLLCWCVIMIIQRMQVHGAWVYHKGLEKVLGSNESSARLMAGPKVSGKK